MELKLKIGKDTVEVYDGPYTSDGSVTEEGVAFAKHVLAIADDAKKRCSRRIPEDLQRRLVWW